MENENRTLIIVVIVVLVLLLFGNFGFGMGAFGGGMMDGFYSGFMFLGWIINIIIIVLIVLGIYWLVKHLYYDDKGINFDPRRRR